MSIKIDKTELMKVNNTMRKKHSSAMLHSNWHNLAYRDVHRLLFLWNRGCIVGCTLNDILVLNDLMKFILNDDAANQTQQRPVELEIVCCLHLLGNEKNLVRSAVTDWNMAGYNGALCVWKM